MYGWQKVVHSVAGWSPSTDFVPAVPAALTLYLSIYTVGQILRQIVKHLAPSVIQDYLFDFVKTLTFCAYPFGHGIVRKFYGEPGYFLAMIPLVTLTVFTFPEGLGNPIGVWLNFHRKRIPFIKSILLTIIEITAGLLAYRLGMTVFELELHPIYVARLTNYYNSFCESDLRVPAHFGFLIEFLAMIYETWFSSQILTNNKFIDTVLKISNAGILVSCGVHLTGMYMHPAMATGHTFGCGDTYKTTHILIYWVGPMIGAWCSVQLQKLYSFNWYRQKKAGKQNGKKNKKDGRNKKLPENVPAENGIKNENGIKKRKASRRKYYQP